MCWSHSTKRLNRSTCCMAADSCWSKEPCVRCRSRSDESICSREGWQDGDAAFFQSTLNSWYSEIDTGWCHSWHDTQRTVSEHSAIVCSTLRLQWFSYQFPARVLGLRFDVRGTFKWLFLAVFDIEMWSVSFCGCCCRKHRKPFQPWRQVNMSV